MTDAHLLTGAPLQELFLRFAAAYTALTGREASGTRQPWLFEILLQAYPDHDADSLMARIDSLIAEHGSEVLWVIEDHSAGAPDYVEARDWLYSGPEVLVVADLARHYPSRLRTVAGPSDFLTELEGMADALSGK
jgi:hypothetical protein